MSRGRNDLSLVEDSITTPDDARRIREIRAQSRHLVTIGACATSGGIQALRNFVGPGSTKHAEDRLRRPYIPADVSAWTSLVYANPEYVDTLATSTGIADHVAVDFELRGCPISITQLAEVVTAFLDGSSRRCCAVARGPSHPTSPRGSAASAPSPTR